MKHTPKAGHETHQVLEAAPLETSRQVFLEVFRQPPQIFSLHRLRRTPQLADTLQQQLHWTQSRFNQALHQCSRLQFILHRPTHNLLSVAVAQVAVERHRLTQRQRIQRQRIQHPCIQHRHLLYTHGQFTRSRFIKTTHPFDAAAAVAAKPAVVGWQFDRLSERAAGRQPA